MEKIKVGEGLLAQLKPPHYEPFTVEQLYDFFREDDWWLLDVLLEHRKDLHDRIKAYKKTKGEQ